MLLIALSRKTKRQQTEHTYILPFGNISALLTHDDKENNAIFPSFLSVTMCMRFSIANWSALKIEFHFEFHAYFSPCELDKVQCLNFANFVTNSRVLSKSDVITYTIILHKLYAINCSKIAKLFTLFLNELQPIEAHTFWF